MTARIKDSDIEHLSWIYDRLANVHSENTNFDYMHKLNAIIANLKLDYAYCGVLVLHREEVRPVGELIETPEEKEALDEKTYRYEKVEDVVSGEYLYVKRDDDYTECLVIGWHPHHPAIVIETGEMIGMATLEDLHRKVTKPIEWWEDLVEYIEKTTDDSGFAESTKGEKLNIVASMTRDQWCDFARILLEQGE